MDAGRFETMTRDDTQPGVVLPVSRAKALFAKNENASEMLADACESRGVIVFNEIEGLIDSIEASVSVGGAHPNSGSDLVERPSSRDAPKSPPPEAAHERP